MNIATMPDNEFAIEDNITDEEKELRISSSTLSVNETIKLTPHLETILESLNPSENDYETLFALSLLYAMGENKGKLTRQKLTY